MTSNPHDLSHRAGHTADLTPPSLGPSNLPYMPPNDVDASEQLLRSESSRNGEKLYPTFMRHGAKSSYHPLNAFLLVIWLFLIVIEIILLEHSVALAPTTTELPWYYSTTGLPAILYTVFAQGHWPVTAMHLSRLFVSALDTPYGRPRTWIEMFWIADRNWSGPVGILTTTVQIVQLRVRVSALFILFSLISIMTLVTPIILDQAYPIKTLDVQVHITFTPDVFSPTKFYEIDWFARLATAKGFWLTNQSVLNTFDLVFNTTSFFPINTDRKLAKHDLFFAGDVRDMDVLRLPGIRLQGGCRSIGSDGLPNLSNSTTFTEYCLQHLDTSNPDGSYSESSTMLAPSSLSLNVSYCSLAVDDYSSLSSNTSFLVWFNNSTDAMIIGGVRGLIRCESAIAIGNASVYGRNRTFDSFHNDDGGMFNSVQRRGPLLPRGAGESGVGSVTEPRAPKLRALPTLSSPLPLALDVLSNEPSTLPVGDRQMIGALGFVEVKDGDGLRYAAPPMDTLADALWGGAMHMTIAQVLLSRDTNTTYPGIKHVPVSGRTRNRPAFITALALLNLWFLSLLGLSAALWRKTSLSGSFDSYLAGRLLAKRTDLVDGDSSGSVGENAKLLEKFVVD